MNDAKSLTPVTDNSVSVGNGSPNLLLYSKLEKLVKNMNDPEKGVPIKTVKSILTKIPDVFSGEDLVDWLVKNDHAKNEQEAIHLGSLIAAYGYFFPIDDHVMALKNDSSFYRFQADYYWPSKGWDPDNMDYAIYLCKRTMQNKARLELADYEAENLARLQKNYARNWEEIFSRAELEAKTDRTRNKLERKIQDSRERAFWDVYRPVPGKVYPFEVDIKKTYSYRDRGKKYLYNSSPRRTNVDASSSMPIKNATPESLKATIQHYTRQLDRHCLKKSKVCETIIAYSDQHFDYDPLCVGFNNPWLSSDQIWHEPDSEKITPRRAARWKFSFNELLKDEAGQYMFHHFLEKEFSAENLDFHLACNKLKLQPNKKVAKTAKKIYQDYFSEEALNPINIDSKIKDTTNENMNKPDRYCFELAQEHIYHLMKSDSYARFLKSDLYKSCLSSEKQPIKSKFISYTQLELSTTD